MSSAGGDPRDLLVRARSALLDVLGALSSQRDAVVVIGAQAVYLWTGGLEVALAEATKDSDVALDPRALVDDPTLDAAMKSAGFFPAASGNPGAWVNAEGIPVDLMVPEDLAGPGNKQTRGARIPPHSKTATRRARGLEAAVVDYRVLPVAALDAADFREIPAKVAGPAALLVAKVHKIVERMDSPHRLNDKDAHDIYRLLRAIDTTELSEAFRGLLAAELCSEVTREALDALGKHFATGPDATGSAMAGRAEEGVGDPEQVSVATALLAQDLMDSLGRY
ncbi:GSU2403 family nucleotidyltransferase fold protein [Psychromicrobium xiongbiense]|uniref:GSU2403 family nucleotidyltransferase fold protein n=1 Tax=Psychromicrobium xiongbiense TaxID=3051184 RepID=UPI0025523320|nr:GSU2403 family nucleotidyltransferase fold protein [Psychromicrobium sp. YIM S02556]